jgi:hypothetical protein
VFKLVLIAGVCDNAVQASIARQFHFDFGNSQGFLEKIGEKSPPSKTLSLWDQRTFTPHFLVNWY